MKEHIWFCKTCERAGVVRPVNRSERTLLELFLIDHASSSCTDPDLSEALIQAPDVCARANPAFAIPNLRMGWAAAIGEYYKCRNGAIALLRLYEVALKSGVPHPPRIGDHDPDTIERIFGEFIDWEPTVLWWDRLGMAYQEPGEGTAVHVAEFDLMERVPKPKEKPPARMTVILPGKPKP